MATRDGLFRDGLLTAAAAAVLVTGVTVAQGLLTERWIKRDDRALGIAADRLERTFPAECGPWVKSDEISINQKELDRAGAVGSVSRLYKNPRTKTVVSAFVVCATPHDASGHTPDRCYPGAGFQIADPEHRETIALRNGGSAEVFTGTFAKQGQTIRVFWTYGVPITTQTEAAVSPATADDAAAGERDRAVTTWKWQAPQIARIALNDFPAVYKLYVIIDQTKLADRRARAECADFIAEMLPAFEAALSADEKSADEKTDEGKAADRKATAASPTNPDAAG